MTARWYAKGLRFECTRCGHCCTGEPGAVRVNDAEIAALATRKQMEVAEFRQAYTCTLPDGAVSLRETSTGACVFFHETRGCSVYEDRPLQCRTWPFWRGVVETQTSWNLEAGRCPGMNRGALRSADEIDGIKAHDGTSADPNRRR